MEEVVLGMIDLKEDQKIIIENVRRMAREQIAPLAAEIDRNGEFRWDIARMLAEMGLFQIYLPSEYGGLEEDACLMFCLCIEEVAKACASSALGIIIQAVGSFPIIEAGSPDQKERFFPRLSTGKELVAYLVTEPQAGSDVSAIQTKGTKIDGKYILSGRKCFATNGGVAALATVLCNTGEGEPTFFILEMDYEGVILGRKEDKLGFRGSNTQDVILEDVHVPEEDRIGSEGEGFKIAMKDFDMSRPGVAALALGIAESAVDLAVAYASQRFTFGKPLVKHQAIEFMIADAYTAIEAARGLMIRAAQMKDRGIQNTKLSSMAKYFSSDAAMRITTDVVQILGGYGYCRDFPAERMFRDAKLTQIFEGANQIQRMVVGREILKEKGIQL
jgi:cyclohexane-1-carbonyl-CoA dehydrogenase